MKRLSKLLVATIVVTSIVLTKLFSVGPESPAGRQFEENILGQLFAIAEHRCGLVFDAKTVEEKNAVLEKMPLAAKERILEELARMVLDENERPFIVPFGSDYSQLDMFFLLSITLMSHNKNFCDGLTRCIGEKDLFKLKVRLDKVLALVNPDIQKRLTPAPGYKAQMEFVKKIKSRTGQ